MRYEVAGKRTLSLNYGITVDVDGGCGGDEDGGCDGTVVLRDASMIMLLRIC